MLNATLTKSSVTRLIRLIARNPAEREFPELFADTELLDHIRLAVSDLDELARFHDLTIDGTVGSKSFLNSKSKRIQKRINDQVKKIEESRDEARQ